MSRVRIGAARTAALLAAVALLGAGCDKAAEVKETVDTAANTAEVCGKSSTLIVDKFGKVQAAAAAAKPADGTAALEKTIAEEFGALHTGLQEQAAKAKDADVKSALEAMDKEAAGWAANPKSFLNVDQKRLTDISSRVDKVCGAK
jgi:hypothetical protein